MLADSEIATCMYYTGIDPFTRQPVTIARGVHDREMQRALMQFFKPENWFTVREALIQAGRTDLIGTGCDCLIPAQPPREAIAARRNKANDPDHYHAVANPAKGGKAGEHEAGAAEPKGVSAGAENRRAKGKSESHRAALCATKWDGYLSCHIWLKLSDHN